MGIVDWLLLGGIALALFLAVRVCVRNRKNGKCCSCDCGNCGGTCKK